MEPTLIKCEDERIQFLNQVQNFGYLIGVAKEDFLIKFFSKNIHNIFNKEISLNEEIQKYISLDFYEFISLSEGQYIRKNITINNIDYHLVIYTYKDFIYLEFEEITHELDYTIFFKYAELLEFSTTKEENWDILVKSIKSLIGYDRVMIYKFHSDGSGIVIAEDKNDNMESYLGMHFPEFDIPIQARNLYFKKKNRLVADINSERIDIVSDNNLKIDLTYSEIRALSPIHLQYLKNFNSQASFSISIIVDYKLWGLVTCQSEKPNHIPITLRKKAEILTNLAKDFYVNFRLENAIKTRDDYKEYLILLKESLIICENFNDIMIHLEKLLSFTKSDGVIFFDNNNCYSSGIVPDLDEITRIKNWAKENELDSSFSSHSFYKNHKEELQLSEKSSGIAFSFLDLDKNYFLIWSRLPNKVTKQWAGKPTKVLERDVVNNEIIHHYSPRKNFSIWYEEIVDQSEVWEERTLIIIEEINRIIIETIHVKSTKIFELYKQLQEINAELDSFSYTVSHDLKAPLTVMKLNCQMLERTLLDDDVKLNKLKLIIEEVDNLTSMLNEILELSKTKKADLNIQRIQANELICKIIETSKIYHNAPNTLVISDNIIDFDCDKTMAYEIFLNVIGNAVKYSSKEEKPLVFINSWIEDGFVIYSIKDNGIGIKASEKHKMFKLFSRMDNSFDFNGNGVGLSIVFRMMERLDGFIDYKSEENIGTEFILKFKENKK